MPQVQVKDKSLYILVDDREEAPFYVEVPLFAIEEAKERALLQGQLALDL